MTKAAACQAGGKTTEDEEAVILELFYGLIYFASALISIWSLMTLKRFLAETPSISDGRSLERFKALVRIEMYAALLLMVILVPGILIGIILCLRSGLPALAVVVVTNTALWALSRYHKKVEVQTRSLQVADALAPEYQRISQSWVKKPLPDF